MHQAHLTAYGLLVEEGLGQGSRVQTRARGPGSEGERGGVSTLDPRPSPLPSALARSVRRGFIYLAPQKRACEVHITSNMRGWVKKALREIRGMLAREMAPEPTLIRGRCTDCEFRNLCDDV